MPTPADQMRKAKQLIQQKRYEDARALLITIDHPKAEVWLNRLNQISNAAPLTQTAASTTDKSFTGKLFLTILLLLFWIFPGIIALAIFGPEAKRYPDAPGAKELIFLNKFIFWIIIIGGLLVVLVMFLAVSSFRV